MFKLKLIKVKHDERFEYLMVNFMQHLYKYFVVQQFFVLFCISRDFLKFLGFIEFEIPF